MTVKIPPEPDRAGHGTQGGHEHTMDRPGRRFGRPAKLNQVDITETAIAIADEHGLDRVTMRRVSHTLEVTPGSLYRHHASREHLIHAMVDRCMADLRMPQSAQGDDWKLSLGGFIRALMILHREHSWLAQAPVPDQIGPVTAEAMTAALQTLDSHPAEAGRKQTALAVVSALVAQFSRHGGADPEYMTAVILAAVAGILDSTRL